MVVSPTCDLQLLQCLWEEKRRQHTGAEALQTRKLVVTAPFLFCLLALVSLGWVGGPQAYRDQKASQTGPHFFGKLADNQRT